MYYICIGLLILIVWIIISFRQKKPQTNLQEHLENCQYGQKSSTKKGNAYFTNSMWSSFFQRDQALNQLEENNVKTRKQLDDYKTNVLKSNSEYANLESQYNTFNINMDNEFRKLHNQLEQNKEKAKQSKQTANSKFNSIDNAMNVMVGSPGDDMESKLKPFVDTAIQTNLNTLANAAIDDIARQPGLRNRWTSQSGSGNIHNWQIIPGLGCPMRVDPESGNVQCLSYDGRNCEWNYVSQNGNDLTKIDTSRVNPLSCGDDHRGKYGSDGYSAGNHWCRTVYNALSKNLTEVDWNMCPVGWTRNNPTGTSCNAPSDYSGPCARTSGFAGYSDQGKQGWAQSCLARWPFKVNVNSAVSSMSNMNSQINKNVQGKLGNLVPKSNLNTLMAYNNGVYVKAYQLNNKSRGNMIQDGLITTNINFNWGMGLIFGIRENPSITNTDSIYMELIGFIKVPAGASTLKFRLTSDDGSRLMLAENTEISSIKTLINNWQDGNSQRESASINVRANTYLPFVVQYYERDSSASLKLEWSINNAPYTIIPREAFFINKDICNYQFNFDLINQINNKAQSLILNLQNIHNYLSQFLNEFKNNGFYEYNLDGSASHIGDGGRDMFDNGNYISIRNGNSISGELSYTTTTPTTVNVGGANAEYISLGYARPLIMLAKSAENGLWGFRKRGNIGSDNNGEKRFDTIYNGENMYGFIVYARAVNWRDRGGSDPTTCDVFFWIGENGSSQMFSQPNLVNPSDGTDNYDYSFTMQCINTLFGSMLLSYTNGAQFVPINFIQQSIQNMVYRLSQVSQ